MPAPVDGWWRRLLLRLSHPRCLVCREAGDDGRELCTRCAATLPWLRAACLRCALPLPGAEATCGHCLRRPPVLAETHAAFLYGTPVDRLLPRLKFHRDLAAGHLLAGCMAEAFAGLPRPDALIAVPLHPARLRRRGYDQALELARPLAHTLGIPLLQGALVRARATTAQSRLDAAQRKRNLRGAFLATARTPLPAHLALVDDVMTTGATLQAAATALRRAGVARVDAWVCARVP
ncbi:ComF family protein [Luteimonas aestuarii]|uniref:ComF family protein n=1 Tax=Luteimonas aestuarii TaxID=453837 RepID=A0A4V3ALI4_9GAMM|nr:ComF family protein [Luteimonas aestuarii]